MKYWKCAILFAPFLIALLPADVLPNYACLLNFATAIVTFAAELVTFNVFFLITAMHNILILVRSNIGQNSFSGIKFKTRSL